MAIYIFWQWLELNRYYGAEQGFNGCGDPENREPLWPSEYDTESELYVYIAAINRYRKGLEIYDGEFQEVWSDHDLYAFSRGDNTLILLTNTGESFNRTIIVNTLKTGLYCNIFDIPEDCFEETGDEELLISFTKGAGKFYVAVEDIPIVTTQFYDKTTIHPEVDGIDGVYGMYAMFIAILMTFWNF